MCLVAGISLLVTRTLMLRRLLGIQMGCHVGDTIAHTYTHTHAFVCPLYRASSLYGRGFRPKLPGWQNNDQEFLPKAN